MNEKERIWQLLLSSLSCLGDGTVDQSLKLLSFQKPALKFNLTHLNFFFKKTRIYALSIPLTHTQLKPLIRAYKRRCISGMRNKQHPLFNILFQWIHVLSTPLTHTQLKPLIRAYKRRCVSGIRNKRYPLKPTNHTNIFYQNYVSFEFPIAPGNTQERAPTTVKLK